MDPPSGSTPKVPTTPWEVYSSSVNQNEEDIRTYGYLIGVQQTKNELIERLIRRVTFLNETLRDEIVQKHDLNLRLHQLQVDGGAHELQLLKSRHDGDCYVLLLIDGDGLIFEGRLLSQGEVGGIEAAGLLSSAVRDHLATTLPDLPSNSKVIVRVYANVKGLAQTCTAAGIIDSPATLENFVRGFNGHKLHFDFVDVGSGKDRADGKVEALLGLHLGNLHCRQIILGVSHDNGYARQLADISDNPQSSSVYLLEGVPFGKELAQLKSRFKTIKFENLFRNTKINVQDRNRQTWNIKRQKARHSESAISYQGDANISVPTPPISGRPSVTSPPLEPVLNRSENPKPMTWAKLAVAAPPPTPPREITPLPPPGTVNTPLDTSSPGSNSGPIQRNILRQRIDPFYPTDQAEWRRVQQLHLCNVHFLRQECKYGDSCTHSHKLSVAKGGLPDGSLTRRDLEILTQVSRYAPCRNGTGCEDVKCIFGHRCPVQENEGRAASKAPQGTPVCRHGKSCKFPPEMHGIDTKVVKVTKV